jgi:hypothetical protein
MMNEAITQSEDLLSPFPCDYIPGLLLISLKYRVLADRDGHRDSNWIIGLDRSRHTTDGVERQQEFSKMHLYLNSIYTRTYEAFLLYLAIICSIRSHTGADRSMQGLFPSRSCMPIHRP